MACTRTTATAFSCAIFAMLAFLPTASAQGRVMPFPGPASPASSAGSGPPCPPGPFRRYEKADAGPSRLFKPTGDPDRDFANMMSAHHQEGIDMARREIADGKSTKLKVIARRIVKDQQQEVLELDRWSARHNLRLSRRDAP